MSTRSFILFLQELLTMVDKDNPLSVQAARNALSSVIALARASKKADAITLRTMDRAETNFMVLVDHQEDFAGRPGSFTENEKKRRWLLHALTPGC